MAKKLKKKIKVGILGGTFDPPHIGHLYISKFALKKLKLNKVIWIVTKKNPLKKKPYLKLKMRIPFNYLPYQFKRTNIFFNHWKRLIKSSELFLSVMHKYVENNGESLIVNFNSKLGN